MKKTLVIVAHPNLESSVVNKLWLEKLTQFPELYTVHNLYEVYPNGELDVLAEQKLVEAHDHIVFQFPFYWFSAPPLLKKWQDLVLTYGWAYGSKGNALVGKSFSLAISAGILEEDYQQSGRYSYTMVELLRPFEIMVNYVKANYLPPFVLYGIEEQADFTKNLSEALLQKSAENYHHYLQSTL